jgi:hypothetical protein
VGERRSVRALAQQQSNYDCSGCVKQKAKAKVKIVLGREKNKSPKPSSGDCVNGLARVPLSKVEPQGANQMAAPAELRTPNMHRAKRSLLESADGSMATSATGEKKSVSNKMKPEFP